MANTGDAQPNPTLYIQNLDSKISKDDLRRLLYTYFSRYGKVLDVIALKNEKMRGQAFIVFKDLATSTAALRKEDGRSFAGKAMRVQYARGKSYATISEESGKEALYQFRLGMVNGTNTNTSRLTVSGAGKALAAAGAGGKRSAAEDGDEDEDEEAGAGAAKRARRDGGDGQAAAAAEEQEDEEMEMSSDDDDQDAPGPAQA